MEELRQWQEEISMLDKLTFPEAKKLYRKYTETQDEQLKKQYMDELILGTLYLVSDYIKKNNLELLSTSSFDMKDIISTLNKAWIKKLQNGVLLKVQCYEQMLQRLITKEVYQELCNDGIEFNSQFGISKTAFVELLSQYIEYRMSGVTKPFEEVIKEKYFDSKQKETVSKPMFDSYYYEMDRKYRDRYDYQIKEYRIYCEKQKKAFNNDPECQKLVRLIPLLERIYSSFNFDKEKDYSLEDINIDNFIKILISIGMKESTVREPLDDFDQEKSILDKLDRKSLLDDIESVVKNPKYMQIIEELYGLTSEGDNPKTYSEVGRNHGTSNQYIRGVENAAFKKIRRSHIVERYKI